MKDSISRTLLRQAAVRHGYTVSRAGDDEYFLEVTHADGRTVMFRGTLNNRNSAIGSLVARRKHLTLQYIAGHHTGVPPYCLYDPATAEEFLRRYAPIVVKPDDAAKSHGVTTDVTDHAQLVVAAREARRHSMRNKVLLQRQIEGRLYRLLVVSGQLVAAALRQAAHVTGDGQSTIRQLVGALNQDPRRGKEADKPLAPVPMEAVEAFVGADALDDVPTDGERVRVTALESVSAGGEAVDVTDLVHPGHAALAEQIARSLDLYVCGFDIICQDIAQAPDSDYWPILELNSGPGLKIHHFPTGGGEPRDAAGAIMDHLFDSIDK